MKLEREQALGAAAHERTESRRGTNGYKPKTLDTRAGRVTVQVSKARGIEFYPGALEKGVRSERALKAAIAEMYVKRLHSQGQRRHARALWTRRLQQPGQPLRANMNEAPRFCPVHIEGDEVPYHGHDTRPTRASRERHARKAQASAVLRRVQAPHP